MECPRIPANGQQLLAGALAVLLLLALASCGAGRKVACGPENYREFSDSVAMQRIVGFLASDALGGRDTGSEGLEQAATYLEGRLKDFGIQPYFDAYRDTLTNIEDTGYNIVGYLQGSEPGLSGEYVLIGAHYDHIGRVAPREGDSIANGANDNATGTAMVLELARFFARCKPPARSLVFAFFSAEERGLMGSAHLAKRLKAQGADLYAMLNFEMTGVPMAGKDYRVYLTGYERSNLAEVANELAGSKLVGLLPQAQEFNLFQRSDNLPFYQEFQVPAHTFSTFDFTNFDYYHLPGDEPSGMDFGHMAELLNDLIPVVKGIADSPPATLKMYPWPESQ
ncbi:MULTISPECIES: M28 family metallopeptidase [Robiginitalea]|uniref:Putative peptidase, M28 family protein n=1 Tax=Robiginitalea biformata (strain ATCC BAA-864 / DSM 15991 / KCTC 12146 / HTCC2501) TaxID=313596 RepID=A4CJQ0_ROBBH|nr:MULTISPECIES: M20/M25/M40 family metallo-hydrolase [Robiginitalea]EAR17158.1 putative peptidase, M28 family protein [Robiginitalea biformata HTCC2501]MDC6355548.1 M20/M25/M40 family metallo-hydrolase [Robiginitalea sp. PM2]MDC6375842.1 M20/M25/M40 family metallo-hydrolase [Robiginitalea sp. SP8]